MKQLVFTCIFGALCFSPLLSQSISFDSFGPYCQNDIADTLPSLSNDSIVGGWIPEVINTSIIGSTTYTFTPNDTLLAPFSNQVIVNPNPTVNTGSLLTAICQGGTSSVMSGSINGGATSNTWSGGSGTWTNSNNLGLGR